VSDPGQLRPPPAGANTLYGVCHEIGHLVVARVRPAGRDLPVVWDEAFAHLDRALEINPRDPRPHVVKGDYYMSVRDAERAISAFEAAIEMDPRHVEAIEKIGNIHALERRLDEALARYERIVEIDPKADPIWIRIASIHAVEGRPAQAQRALDEAMKRIPASNQQIQALQQRINQMSRPGDG